MAVIAFPAPSTGTPERRSSHRLRPERTPRPRGGSVDRRHAARLPARARPDRRQGRLRRGRVRRLRRAPGRAGRRRQRLSRRQQLPAARCRRRPGTRSTRSKGWRRTATLADAQQAMAAAGGSQCGYCTPGFVMSLFAEQYRPDRVGPCDPLAMAGNLCRCTGYRPIRDAALSLGPAPPGALARSARRSPRRALDAVRLPRLLAAGDARRVSRGARGASRRGRHRWRLGPRRRIESARHALAAPRQPRSDRRAARVHRRRDARCAIGAGAAARRTSSGCGSDAPAAVARAGSRSSRRRRFAIAPRSAATSPRRRRSATRRRCCSRSTRSSTSPGRDGRRAIAARRRSSPATGAPRSSPARSSPRSRSRSRCRSTCASTRSPSAGSTTSARSRRRWRSTCDAGGRVRRARFAFGGVAATPVRVDRGRRRRRPASRGPRRPSSGCSASSSATLTPISDHRGSAAYRLGRCRAAWSRSSSRSHGHEHGGPARSARERARARDRATRSTPTTSPGAFPHLLHAWPVLAPHAHALRRPRSTRRRRSTSRASSRC